jgi:hypothetical protein
LAVLIDDIQGMLGSTNWYYGAGDYFQTKYTNNIDPASITTLGFSTVNSSSTEYWMFGGNFSIEPVSLVADLTVQNGGRAKGTFAAGATLTISGELYRDSDYEIVADGELIVADIMYEWQLEEMEVPPFPNNTVRGHAYFNITGGALSSASSNLDGLVLNDFILNFTFERCTPNVTDFGTTTATYSCSGPKVQGGPIPEPASIMLMGLGALAIFRRRRK